MSRALLSLTPAESKILIGRAVAQDPAVGRALERGLVILSLGTTNAAVAEAITGQPRDPLRFAAGVIQAGHLCPTPAAERLAPLVLLEGEPSEQRPVEALEAYQGSEAVIIKGGNAVDAAGRVGVLMAAADGGTVGRLLVRARAAGLEVISPVGLEKLIADVPAACAALGQRRLDRSLGARCGMMELVGARAVTEREALTRLIGVDEVIHVASGGVCGSEGSVTLTLSGQPQAIDRAVALVESIKGAQGPTTALRPDCQRCTFRCDLAGPH